MPDASALPDIKSSHKVLTKIIALLFLTMIVISCYLIQRGILTAFFADRINIDPAYQIKDAHGAANMGQSQLSFMNLEFTYSVMNVFWPLVVFVLFMIISLLLKKQAQVRLLIVQAAGADDNMAFDPYNIYYELNATKRIWHFFRFLVYLPAVAIVTHFLSGLWIGYTIEFTQIANVGEEIPTFILPNILLQTIISIFVIFLTVPLPRKILATIRSYSVSPI